MPRGTTLRVITLFVAATVSLSVCSTSEGTCVADDDAETDKQVLLQSPLSLTHSIERPGDARISTEAKKDEHNNSHDVAPRNPGPSQMTFRCLSVTLLAAAALAVLWSGIVLPPFMSPPAAAAGEAGTERLCLLDNAKVFCMFQVVFGHILYYSKVGEYPDGKTWLSGSNQPMEAVMAFTTCCMLPPFVFISGVCSQGSVTDGKRMRYLVYLVAPTLLWICVAKPVIFDSLLTMNPKTLWEQLQALAHFNTCHEEWYLQALVIWRGLVYLLWDRMHPAVALFSMMYLSCWGGYYDWNNGPWFKVDETLGFLPYFAIGYVFPFQAACRMIPRPGNFMCILVSGLLVAWAVIVVPWMFPEGLPDGHGSYNPKELEEAVGWDHMFFWTRRFAKTVVEMPAVLTLLFLVLPRGPTPVTWVGPHTLYPFCFHLLAHTWRSRLLEKLALPTVTSISGHCVVLLIHIPYCAAVIAFFASTFWRSIFGWCLSPSWLEPLIMKSDAKRKEVETEKTIASDVLAGADPNLFVPKVG